MIRWMCDVKVTDRFTRNELREILAIDDIVVCTVVWQNRLRWCGQVSRKDKYDWVKTHGL